MKIETNHSRKQVQVNLDSIALLKNDLTLIIDKPLTNIFNNAVYVGIVDPWKDYAVSNMMSNYFYVIMLPCY